MYFLFAVLFAIQCATASIILDCKYSKTGWEMIGNVYTCEAKVVQYGGTRSVMGVTQNHQNGQYAGHVKALNVEKQQIDFIPKDINLFFVNLELLFFKNCPIKSVTKDDLRPFRNLKLFRIWYGKLTTISGDVFMYSPNLRYIDFDDNEITNVGPGIFQHSPQLVSALFRTNVCINSYVKDSAEAVARIGRELAVKCPPTFEMSQAIILQILCSQLKICK